MSQEATIHLRVPALTKARWVRESRASGQRLGEWIAAAVEAQHPHSAHCPRCEHDVTPYDLDGDWICPKCQLML